MNLWRFLKKCAVDRPAAARSARLTARGFYGKGYWLLRPNAPLAYKIPRGGTLLLEPGHSFTGCFWPGGIDYYEPDVRALLLGFLKPGYTFIDCGANVGYFSVQASGLVGRVGKVVSIEANPVTFKLLQRNLNENESIVSINCALTAQSGYVELFVPSDGDVYSSLHADGLVKESSTIRSMTVPSRTLDDIVVELGLDRIDVVKIDIEGGELDVLRSSPLVLSRFRPVVIVEYGTNTWPSFDATPRSLMLLADRYRYELRVFDIKQKSLVPIPADIWERPYVNLVLLPRSDSNN
jgi:FkbM family methyltransferase